MIANIFDSGASRLPSSKGRAIQRDEGEALFFRTVEIYRKIQAETNLDNRAVYHRMTALVYRVAPEAFEGMAIGEIARLLGISGRAFKAHITEAEKMRAGFMA